MDQELASEAILPLTLTHSVLGHFRERGRLTGSILHQTELKKYGLLAYLMSPDKHLVHKMRPWLVPQNTHCVYMGYSEPCASFCRHGTRSDGQGLFSLLHIYRWSDSWLKPAYNYRAHLWASPSTREFFGLQSPRCRRWGGGRNAPASITATRIPWRGQVAEDGGC